MCVSAGRYWPETVNRSEVIHRLRDALLADDAAAEREQVSVDLPSIEEFDSDTGWNRISDEDLAIVYFEVFRRNVLVTAQTVS